MGPHSFLTLSRDRSYCLNFSAGIQPGTSDRTAPIRVLHVIRVYIAETELPAASGRLMCSRQGASGAFLAQACCVYNHCFCPRANQSMQTMDRKKIFRS